MKEAKKAIEKRVIVSTTNLQLGVTQRSWYVIKATEKYKEITLTAKMKHSSITEASKMRKL